MLNRLWIKFLVLLVIVIAVGLSSTVVLREFMIKDFRAYLGREMDDRIGWLVASLESSYSTYGGWEAQDIMDSIVWAAMMGIDIRVFDDRGRIISDTEAAFNTLTPLVKDRVLAFYGPRIRQYAGAYKPYPLRVEGAQFGRLDARVLAPREEAVFIRRSNRVLVVSVLALGSIAIMLSIIFARRLTNPIDDLTHAAADIADGNFARRVRITSDDELGRLSGAFNSMAQKLLVQERLRKKLTANIAHELRTPISAVRAELEGMIDGLIPADKQELQSLYAEIGRLRTLLDGIEDLSQAEASSLNIARQPLAMRTFLENIVNMYRKGFGDKGVMLELSCRDEPVVNADPDKLSQVVINLLGNALKATGHGDTVSVEAYCTQQRAVIVVTDTGGGIAAEDLPYIFERFYRAAKGGLGLGLTIVKELVDAHGGTVTVKSVEGEGSEFTVSLPL